MPQLGSVFFGSFPLDFWLRFDRKARDMQQKYELRMKEIRDEMAATLGDGYHTCGWCNFPSQERQRRKQIQMIEESLPEFKLLTANTTLASTRVMILSARPLILLLLQN